MPGLLRWRDGQRGDKQALCGFTCTEDYVKSFLTGWQRVHPKPWEYEVQSLIRDLKPPYSWPKCLLLGFDDDGLAAVAHYREVDGPAQILLEALAVARRLRGVGGGYADDMADELLSTVTDRALEKGVSEVLVEARVFHTNLASQDFCRRFGMRHTGNLRPEVQVWSYRLLV
ncbi:GNAT family N-acetyltransferase [Kribbella sp. NPDC048915]|uniref:GNAT family N-acetyltransferase n=1 Tax=Kribbella sp. NPDC048915 TaxID=3155148 RepID=UPI0033C55F7F